jgi:hypothetical protein
MGTLSAIRKFDASRGNRLSTLAITNSEWFVFNSRKLVRNQPITGVQIGEPDQVDGHWASGDKLEEVQVAAPEAPCEYDDAQLAAKLAAKVRETKLMDDVDREIYFRRMAVRDGATHSELAVACGMTRNGVSYREARLREHVLPRVFAEFRDVL